jgi:hypothetical protein
MRDLSFLLLVDQNILECDAVRFIVFVTLHNCNYTVAYLNSLFTLVKLSRIWFKLGANNNAT